MALNRAAAGALLSPEQIGQLVIRPLQAASVAARTAAVVATDASVYRVPIVLSDPNAGWVDEGNPLPLTDATFGSLEIAPTKVGAITVVTSETIDDSEVDVLEVLGDGLVRDLAKKVDAAWFGALASPAQSGLAALAAANGSEVQTVSAGSSWTSLDPFAEAAAKIEGAGGQVSAFVTSPTDALALAKIKASTGSQVPLLAPGQDPAQPARRLVEGRPLLVSASVPSGTVWAYDGSTSYVVIRRQATVDVDRSVFFSTDQVAVRLTCRIGFGHAAPARIVKITKA